MCIRDSSHLYNIERARYAIQTIARLVGNSASEPAATGSQPLDAWTVAAVSYTHLTVPLLRCHVPELPTMNSCLRPNRSKSPSSFAFTESWLR